MNYAYQVQLRPVAKLGNVYSSLTLPAFTLNVNEPAGKCLEFKDAAYVTGAFGTDIELAGTPDPDLLNQIYFDVWVKPISFSGSQTQMSLFRRVVGSGGAAKTTFALSIDTNGSVVFFIQKDASNSKSVTSFRRINFGEWNHIGVVWDGSQGVGTGKNGYIWINGEKETYPLVTNSAGPYYNTSPVVYAIGKYPATLTPVQGDFYIDELRLWYAAPPDLYFQNWRWIPRANNAAQQTDNAASPGPYDNKLKLYFKFNGSGSPWVNDMYTGVDSFTAGSSPPEVITKEEYPGSLYGVSSVAAIVDLNFIGKNFTFLFPQNAPNGSNFSLAVAWIDKNGNGQRRFLWKTKDLKGADEFANYAGETILYSGARLEVWYNWLDRVCSLTTATDILLGILYITQSWTPGDVNNISGASLDTTFKQPLTAAFPWTFNT